MKREIKFRFWDKNKNIMCEDFPDYLDGYNLNMLFEVKDFVPMQFTGLKDKNGKEVFEGDIVIKYPSRSRGNRKVQSYDGVVFEIEYQKEWACFMANAGKLSWLFELAENEKWDGDNEKFLTSDCEIIGNIYENPELIK